MDVDRRLLVEHRFGGPRFERHGLDLAVLPELVAYRSLVVECAKQLWRRRHPDRERLSPNYESSIVLVFSRIEQGSVVVPIERVRGDEQQLTFLEDEVDQAAGLIADTIEAATAGRPLPEEFPKELLGLFRDYGSTLRQDEWMEQRPGGRETPVRYTQRTREWLTRRVNERYEEPVDLVGSVTMIRLIPPRFERQFGEHGPRIEAPFEPAAEDAILTALSSHQTAKVRVRGRGEFTPAGLHRILRVDEVQLFPEGEAPVNPGVPRIWERARALMADVPEEQLRSIPPSEHVDRVVYGADGR